ncbi:hypothetical protein [Xylella taiwanensis]|uniref:Uncharacterized protein n=1 Tax=Xylella taiwanensis TaxID=1444770 RepID=Z9JK17_9GAMM|nr:hypothetical protein [Xylella taiwanensis]EWS78504.1 hypothetical protein AF72_05840 [Xylella taiwanensis]UFM93203.1 hypothetical protein LPH39_08750 [Xylella taiwanensis]UFN17690.1 hypothetical protein LPH64_08750 [Xylella taiwanensis]UFN23183.1 hypothetical protein LPH48_03060 [Xylella taiwanensis]
MRSIRSVTQILERSAWRVYDEDVIDIDPLHDALIFILLLCQCDEVRD